MTRLQMLDLLGSESPTYDRIRYVCLAPGEDGQPWLSLPRTYDLDDRTSYFWTDIMARHERMLTRASWAAAFKSPGESRQPAKKAGEDEGVDSATPEKGKGKGDRTEADAARAGGRGTGGRGKVQGKDEGKMNPDRP